MSRRRDFAELIPVLLREEGTAVDLKWLYAQVVTRRPDLADDEPDPHAPTRPKWQHDLRWELQSAVGAGRIHKRDDLGRGFYSLNPAADGPKTSTVQVVEIERATTEPVQVVTPQAARLAMRLEGQLVHRYVAWATGRGRVFKRLVMRTPDGERLVTDLYEPDANLLIEAKFDSSRQSVRMAIGQLLDYQAFAGTTPRLAVLLSAPPARSIETVLANNRVALITEVSPGLFHEPSDTSPP